MGIQTTWYDDDETTILLDFDPDWNWADLGHIDDITDTMMEGKPYKVCYIADMTRTKLAPKHMPLGNMQEVLDLGHPNTGIVVVVGMNSMIRMMLETAMRIIGGAKDRLIFTNTVADAEAIIARYQKKQAA